MPAEMLAQNKLTDRVASLSIPMLQKLASDLQSDHREGSEIVLSAVLDSLLNQMSDEAFIAFCDSL